MHSTEKHKKKRHSTEKHKKKRHSTEKHKKEKAFYSVGHAFLETNMHSLQEGNLFDRCCLEISVG